MKKVNLMMMGILLTMLMVSSYIASANAETEDYVPPEVSIVMMTDFSDNTFGNNMKMSKDGKYVVADTVDNVILYSVPESFDGESEIIWNLTSHVLSYYVDINEDGSKISFVDADVNKYYCYGKTGTDDLWAFDYGINSVNKALMCADGGVFFLAIYVSSELAYNLIGINGTNGNEMWRKSIFDYPNIANFNRNGSTLGLGFANGTVLCLDGYTGDQLWKKQGLSSSVATLEISDDGSTMVTSGLDVGPFGDNVTVWDTLSGNILWNSIIEAAYKGFSMTESGDKIIIGSYTADASDKRVRCYARNAKDLTWEIATTSQVRATKISLDGKIAVAGIYDGMVMIIDAEVGRSIMNHNTYSSEISLVQISDDGTVVSILTNDGMFIVYKIDVVPGTVLSNLSDLVKNLDLSHYILMGGSALVGLILGGLLFGLTKKKK
ncbi:WD40 repeat domain-containing protein [Promethearchaeum syntrophicum]|uniref:WD40 repeat domain-containing protein n=1 Tax=Promethearchaeum syntrophicum TaxID=2594042 RepID=A0A5B9DDS4_9ARCH|nr:PQQ-binding-like beta-propeller repeat protein [Candidatus Prometheoarchaeum syntrophicum]QEE16876.1 Outer membrane protein assembly factor BamB [Candidatus Prometheoarchaeum syntrophicum]